MPEKFNFKGIATAVCLGSAIIGISDGQAEAAQKKTPTIEQAIKKCGKDFTWDETVYAYRNSYVQEHHLEWNRKDTDTGYRTPYVLIADETKSKIAVLVFDEGIERMRDNYRGTAIDSYRVPAIIDLTRQSVQCATLEQKVAVEFNYAGGRTIHANRRHWQEKVEESTKEILSDTTLFDQFQSESSQKPKMPSVYNVWQGEISKASSNVKCAPLHFPEQVESPRLACKKGKIVLNEKTK